MKVPQLVRTACGAVVTALPLFAQSPRFSTMESAAFPSSASDAACVAVFDADGDRRPDVVVGQEHGADRLFLQLAAGPRFVNRTAGRLPSNWVSDRQSIVPVDIDGDGDQDLLTHAYNGPNRLLFNDGTATFAEDATRRAPGFGACHSVCFFDEDGDGDLDLLTGNSVLYVNDGTGRFASSRLFPLTPSNRRPASLWPSDIDADGDLDVVIAHTSGIGAFRNGGAGTWTHEFHHSGDTTIAACGDITGDGLVDVVSQRSGSHLPSVWVNDGTGRFVPDYARPSGAALGEVASIALADCDGDGDLDLVAGSQPVQLSWNDGTGTFVDAGIRIPWPNLPSAMAANDLDADGDDDVVIVTMGGVPDGVLLGDPLRGLAPAGSPGPLVGSGHRTTRAVAAADLDGDGIVEIVAGSVIFSAGGSGVVRHATTLDLRFDVMQAVDIAIGDVDGDGDPDIVQTSTGWPSLHENRGALGFVDATHWLPQISVVGADLELLDADADGDLDLFLTSGASTRMDHLWINDGSGRFSDESAARLPNDARPSPSCAAADVDRDGDIDLLVGHPDRDSLLLNRGDGTFVDASANWPTPFARTFVIVPFDADGDGDLDLFTGTAAGQDRFYENDGQGRFVDRTAQSIPPQAGDTWDASPADLDSDGDVDLVLGHTLTADRWLRNDGTGSFTAVTLGGFNDVVLGLVAADVDADGDVDAVTARLADGLASDRFDRIWFNRTRHVHMPWPARPGMPLRIEYHAIASGGAGDALVLPWFSLGTVAQPLRIPGVGRLWLEPSSMFPDDPGRVPLATGRLERTFTLPTDPALLGVDLALQMLVDDLSVPAAYRLSNVARAPIVF